MIDPLQKFSTQKFTTLLFLYEFILGHPQIISATILINALSTKCTYIPQTFWVHAMSKSLFTKASHFPGKAVTYLL